MTRSFRTHNTLDAETHSQEFIVGLGAVPEGDEPPAKARERVGAERNEEDPRNLAYVPVVSSLSVGFERRQGAPLAHHGEKLGRDVGREERDGEDIGEEEEIDGDDGEALEQEGRQARHGGKNRW